MPYLTPQSIPVETTCRPLIIPDDTEWLGLINGALTELLKLHNWEQANGGITREAAVARAWVIVTDFWENSCEGGGIVPRIYRIGLRGQLQFSFDVGATWTDAEGAITEPLPARTEPTEHDKKCAAAANAENVLRQTYLELLEAFNTDSSVSYGIAVFAAILGLLIAAFWLPVAVITALINFALGAFGAAWAGLQFLSADDWTVQFQDDFICLMYNNSTVTNGVVTFDYMAVRDNLQEMSGEVALKFWVFYILQVIGAEGLNAAGATTGAEEHDCDDCPEDWCHEFDFTVASEGFVPYAAGYATWVSGQGWRSGYFDDITQIVNINRTFEPDPVVNRIEIDYYMPALAASGVLYGSINGSSMGNASRVQGLHTRVLTGTWTLNNLQVGANNYPTSAGNYHYVRAIRIYGSGYNPFGESNC